MVNKTILSGISWLVLLLVMQTPVHAVNTGWYAGFSIGSAEVDAINESDMGYKFTGGYLENNFGAEMSLVGLGDGYTAENVDVYGLSMEFIGRVPLSPSFSLLGKLGIFWWTVENCYSGYYYYYCPTGTYDDGSDLTYGLGMQLDMNNRFSFRAEWQNFEDISGSDVSLVSAGFIYSF